MRLKNDQCGLSLRVALVGEIFRSLSTDFVDNDMK